MVSALSPSVHCISGAIKPNMNGATVVTLPIDKGGLKFMVTVCMCGRLLLGDLI